VSTHQELKSRVSLSLDAWTSTNQYAFLAIVAHYTANDGVLGKLCLIMFSCFDVTNFRGTFD